jgi:predicted dithiol-disulfide oxidoreductase (DUF899 family)
MKRTKTPNGKQIASLWLYCPRNKQKMNIINCLLRPAREDECQGCTEWKRHIDGHT